MRKGISLFLALLCLLFAVSAQAENLLANADFAQLDDSGTPEGWRTDAYNSGNSQFRVETLEDGTTALAILNFDDNDARWVQTVAVEPNTEYVLTCRVLAKDCAAFRESDGSILTLRGANLSILNTNAYSDSVYDTDGEWVTLTLYGATGDEQTTMDVALRLGGYSGDGVGEAWFQDVTMEARALADGAVPVSLATFQPQRASTNKTTASASAPERITETLVLIAFGILLAGLALLAQARRMKARGCELSKTASAWLLGAVMLAALAVRLYFAVRVRGYSVDINDFMIWGENFLNDGAQFYVRASFCDYPPLTMLLMGAVALVRRMLGIEYLSTAHVVLTKLIPIGADLLLALLVYFLFSKKAGRGRALLLTLAIALNPAHIADSAAWGQVDSLLTLLLAVCLYFASEGKWHWALPVYALSLLSKPQALLFGPIGLVMFVIDLVRRKNEKGAVKHMLFGLVGSLAILYFVALPFSLQQSLADGQTGLARIIAPIPWLKNLFAGATTNDTYRCLTLNACNFYELLNRNWMRLENAPGLAVFSWVMFGASYVYAAFLCLYARDRRALPLIGAAMMALIYAFAPMMHERYLFPVIALLALAYIQHPDRRLLWALLAVTLTQFLNITLVLQGGTVSEYAYLGHLNSDEVLLNTFVSAVNVLTALFLAYTAFSILVLGHTRPLPAARRMPDTPLQRLRRRNDWRLHLTRVDCLLMAAVTVVYACVAFVNLGSTKAPQTYWQNEDYEEQVVFDLGDVRTFRMTYYGGISSASFTVALSNDGEHWTEENYAVYGEGEIFRWHWYAPKARNDSKFIDAVYDEARAIDTGEGGARVSYPTSYTPYPLQTARYVRLTVMGIGLKLHEVGFWNVDDEVLYPVASITGSREGADYTALTDEPDTVAWKPSYYNGTYFDEIYHARTAYELLHGPSVSNRPNATDGNWLLEWSHPHLGKLLLMQGIRLFGMTPFGWRFMGTLIGVLMLPLMYLMVKQLTKDSKLSFVAMFLLAVDSMHFTQTRLATVDSYAVFFIILMYLFMFRYAQMNLLKQPLGRTLVPLGLCGISMGLACASKWIGMYAGVGLAIIFFATVFLRLREYRALRRESESEEDAAMARAFPKKLLLTLLFCVLFFVVIPFLIYYFCYWQHFAPVGGLTLTRFWDMQVQMFNYHSRLVDSHYFSSPWYEWPTIVRPMWYYSAETAMVGYGRVSSISCMGNPIVWWAGLVAMVALLIALCASTRPSPVFLLIAVGFASQYLPWVLVPRSTFIYHYFASVPFIIIATVLWIGRLRRMDSVAGNTLAITLMVLALLLFVAFYPLESGYPCAYSYALKLRWFNWYNFALQ